MYQYLVRTFADAGPSFSTIDTCTLAIVMLDFFDPPELGLPTGAIFAPRDIATFTDLGAMAIRVADECLSKVSQLNETGDSTGAVGFTSPMGWGSVGESCLAGVSSAV